MKSSKLTGTALDWAVAKCEGLIVEIRRHSNYPMLLIFERGGEYGPSYNWAQGGPIIEREKMTLGKQVHKNNWSAESFNGEGIDTAHIGFGPTPLIAAMRCHVSSKLGDEVEIPEELL